MTGFGRAAGTYEGKTYQIEIKSLNAKNSDIRYKCDNALREKEMVIRQMIMEHAKRGKIDFSLSIESQNGQNEYRLNSELIRQYLQELITIQEDLGLQSQDLMSAIFKIPNIVESDDSLISEDEWTFVNKTIFSALDALKHFRLDEGIALEKDLKNNVHQIQSLLEKIKEYELERFTTLKARLRKNLTEFISKENVDENRFEQEVVYYMEKLDINEEKVRLTQHCEYFLDALSSSEEASGRKLTFISQEMGREINTLGAKAQHSNIQQIVVQMKDNLEKIKEQLANVL